MKLIHYFLNNKIFFIFILSFILFISKWYHFIFIQKNIEVEFLFNFIADGKYWIPYIKFISELNLNYSYDPFIENLKILPIPLGSLFLYSIFFKFINLYSLILIELFAIFFFLLIFFKIFNKITNQNNSILFSLILISLPKLIFLFDINFHYIVNTLENFYSLRPHRPIFSNLFFYLSIYFLLKELFEKKLNRKNFYYLSFFMGLTFSSFYYFFLILFISLTFIILYKNKKNLIFFLKSEYLTLVKSFFIFLIASTPFIINLILHESDVSKSAGLINNNLDRKLNIINYYVNIFFNIKFISVLILTTILFLIVKNKENKVTTLFYIIFISSILSPLIFFATSPKTGLVYHFNNNILLCLFLFFVFSGSFLFLKYIKINFKICYMLIFLIISFNIFSNIKENNQKQLNLNSNKKSKEFTVITDKINEDFNNKLKASALLTFDTNFMIWGILKNFKYINILNHMWTPKTYEMIEEDLVKNFKFLNLKKKDLGIFLKNNFEGWRYFNENLGELFGYRYQANSFVTKNFDKFENEKIKNFISSSPPSLNQQIAITKKERDRIINLFDSNKDYNFRKPEIIIINLDKNFLRKYSVDEDIYCIKFKGNFYSLYYLKKIMTCD